HFAAYAGSAAIAMAGYGLNRGAVRVIGCFGLYAGVLEYLQNFSPGRNPELVDFAALAFGALCGRAAVVLLWHCRSAWPGWGDPAERPLGGPMRDDPRGRGYFRFHAADQSAAARSRCSSAIVETIDRCRDEAEVSSRASGSVSEVAGRL